MTLDHPNAFARQFDFWNSQYEGRRLFSELLGTFFLVLVAAGGGVVNARFGGHVIPTAAQVVAPALMVMAIILFMGTVSGAHLNPAVGIAWVLRGPGGGKFGRKAAQGTLGLRWRPGPVARPR